MGEHGVLVGSVINFPIKGVLIMAKFINSIVERHWGMEYFKEHVMAPEYDISRKKNEYSEFYAKHGFKVSLMYGDFFSKYSGIESDRYPSMDLIYFYMMPCLCRHDFMWAYVDKNLFSEFFHDVSQPETVVKCWNGIFYDSERKQISKQNAVDITIGEKCDLIIKPTVETMNGDNVVTLDNSGRDSVVAMFDRYGVNFIVQRKLKQHPDLARLNPSSFNTYRILTYRDIDKKVHFLDEISHIRIGGKGSAKDNLSSGGVACHIMPDGTLVDACTRYKSMKVYSMKSEYGVQDYKVPCFKAAADFAISLHQRLPYFDFIGWDVGILPDESPVFIEYNVIPGVEGPQSIAGPLFGKYLEEVMERVKIVRCDKVAYSRRTWPNGFDHKLLIG